MSQAQANSLGRENQCWSSDDLTLVTICTSATVGEKVTIVVGVTKLTVVTIAGRVTSFAPAPVVARQATAICDLCSQKSSVVLQP